MFLVHVFREILRPGEALFFQLFAHFANGYNVVFK